MPPGTPTWADVFTFGNAVVTLLQLVTMAYLHHVHQDIHESSTQISACKLKG